MTFSTDIKDLSVHSPLARTNIVLGIHDVGTRAVLQSGCQWCKTWHRPPRRERLLVSAPTLRARAYIASSSSRLPTVDRIRYLRGGAPARGVYYL